MLRLNPKTNKRFKHGEAREDGYLFESYRWSRVRKNGYYAERWCNPKSFERRKGENKSRKKFYDSVITLFLNDYKLRNGCSSCGYAEHSCALDAHHVDPKTKKFCIASVRKSSFGKLRAIKEELKKCIILCSNCHRVETKRNQAKKEG
jgi:hypothetical protein